MKEESLLKFYYQELTKLDNLIGENNKFKNKEDFEEYSNLMRFLKNDSIKKYDCPVNKHHFNFSLDRDISKKNIAQNGWKLHVAIDDSDPKNIAKGWDLVVDILAKHEIAEFKIIRPYHKLSIEEEAECGNQISIYCFAEKEEKNWPKIVEEISETLEKNQIVPSPKSPINKFIKGTPYVTFRNDTKPENWPKEFDSHPDTKYVGGENVIKFSKSKEGMELGDTFKLYNPSNSEDIYKLETIEIESKCDAPLAFDEFKKKYTEKNTALILEESSKGTEQKNIVGKIDDIKEEAETSNIKYKKQLKNTIDDSKEQKSAGHEPGSDSDEDNTKGCCPS